jgi:hypothetical protein
MVEDYPPIPPPARRPLPPWNPITRQRHNREVFWQITIPLTIGIVLILGLALLTVLAAYADQAHQADVAFIWLAGIQLIMGLLTLGMLAGVIFGLFRLMQSLPGYTRLTQDFLGAAGLRVRRVADAMVEPILRGHEFSAGWRAFWGRRRR